jgi:hypothetical protein
MGTYQPASEAEAPVRFAEGYDAYARSLHARGLSAASLAGDLPSLIQVLAEDTGLTPELKYSAAIFLGNSIATRYPSAEWSVMGEPMIGPGSLNGTPLLTILRQLQQHPHRHTEFADALHGTMSAAS